MYYPTIHARGDTLRLPPPHLHAFFIYKQTCHPPSNLGYMITLKTGADHSNDPHRALGKCSDLKNYPWPLLSICAKQMICNMKGIFDSFFGV